MNPEFFIREILKQIRHILSNLVWCGYAYCIGNAKLVNSKGNSPKYEFLKAFISGITFERATKSRCGI
ncbi:hypothetical protein SDC9_153773 [bioreactor metagenome]|uniref:Uncharacterized protein n=1 Tax=bioreactor metagenome TaxID=1076179 RepID=A0A645EX86_9ZZZZ